MHLPEQCSKGTVEGYVMRACMTLSFKNLCIFPSFLLLVETNSLEFYLKPHLRSAEAGERLGTRQ